MVDEARAQKMVDQMIKSKGAQFIRQIHLLRPLLKKLTIDGKLDAKLPLQLLLPFITQPDLKEQIANGKGLQCRAFAPRNVSFEITIKAAALKVGDETADKPSVIIESEDWKEVIGNGKIKENAVLSLWVFYTGDDQQTSASISSPKSKPGFIFRVDGYVKKNEPLPPISSTTK